MATQVIMPQMGFDMKEGTVVRWVKHEGDTVSRGETLAEIETDKAVVEIEAFASGVLKQIAVKEGVTVPVGQVIAVIAAPEEEIPAAPELVGARRAVPSGPSDGAPASAEARPGSPTAGTPQAPASAEGQPAAETPPAASARTREASAPSRGAPAALPQEDGRVRASPLAKKEAESRGVDIAGVKGTGPGGRVTREDVIAFAEAAPRAPAAPAQPAPAAPESAGLRPGPAQPSRPAQAAAVESKPGEVVPFTRMRQAIANAMSKSKREIPHFYVTIDIDMSEAVKLRSLLNDVVDKDNRISINDMVIKACAKALPKHPMFNASYTEKGIQTRKEINVGIAVALKEGLIAPAIMDCASKSLADIARASHDVVERARSGVLNASEYTNSTFNVTNLGMYNVENFSAIVTPPQSAALAVGSVRKAAVVKDGQIVIADMMKVTLSIDHRVADGAQAALFMADVRSLLEKPALLLL